MSYSRNTHGRYDRLQDDHHSASKPQLNFEGLLQEGLRNFKVDTTLSGAANLMELLRWAHFSGLLGAAQPAAVAIAIYSMLQNQHSHTPSEPQLRELACFFGADDLKMVEAAKLLERLQPTFDQHSFGVQSLETHKIAYFWVLYHRQKSAEILRQEIMTSFDLKGNSMSDYELSQVGQENFVILDSFTPTLGGGMYIIRQRDKSHVWLLAIGAAALLVGMAFGWSATAPTQPKKQSKRSDDET